MKYRVIAWLLAGIVLASNADAALLLRSNLNNEIVDQNVPTGGAAAGEPIFVDVPGMAVVRQGAFSTPSLQITDVSTISAHFVNYEFLNSTEVTTGTLKISFVLSFAQLGNYIVGVREQNGAAQNFYDATFTDTGFYFLPGTSGTYAATTPLTFELVFDLDARTVDTRINGAPVANGVPMGGTVVRGIGSIFFGHNFDADTNGQFDLDDLVVVTPADTIFIDGFDLP